MIESFEAAAYSRDHTRSCAILGCHKPDQAFCPISLADCTKMFHVKHFGKIDGLRKRTFGARGMILSVVRVFGTGGRRMRYPACEKLEIIQLVEHSHLPVRRTLEKLKLLAHLS